MNNEYLGPLSTSDIGTLRRAMEAHLDSIDDALTNGPVFDSGELIAIRSERSRTERILNLSEVLVLKE